MQVILQEDIASLGKAGEVVNVRDGYGRNYLLPQKKAVVANPKNLGQLEHQKRLIAAKQQKIKKQAAEMAERLTQVTLNIAREVGEGDKLFGSVTAKDIVDALRANGLTIDRHAIELSAPLKELGIFDVPVKLHPEVQASVKVGVVKK